TKEVEPSLKARIDRKAELERSQTSGPYAEAKGRLDQLTLQFDDAETRKTFGASDLDEAYYHRQEAEYERDKVATEVRALLREHYAATDPKEGEKKGDALYADPKLSESKGLSEKMFHLQSEIERMEAHIKHIDETLPNFVENKDDPKRDEVKAIRK